jgi:putative membrane protein
MPVIPCAGAEAMKPPPYDTNDLAVIRTELAFQRNRLALDRTLMAIMRTSLALISFGFTIFSVFNSLSEMEGISRVFRDETPARFGLALVSFGVILLVAGVVADIRSMARLRAQHGNLLLTRVYEGSEPMPRSLVVVAALLLIFLGLVAVLIMVLRL